MTRETMSINAAKVPEAAQSSTVIRQMSITVAQFSDRLPQVREGMLDPGAARQGSYRLRNANGTVEISCRQLAARYIGSLALPVIEVRLDFGAYRSADIDRFVKSFDLAFLKMGC